MSLYISALASGSNGNCYYIGNESEAILVDAGISCRETEKRMKRVGLSMNSVQGIFISHEHKDHTRGVEVISRKYNIPVFITDSTYKSSRLMLKPNLVSSFSASMPVKIGNLLITSFPKSHDASEPHSFTINGQGIHVGVYTDIGIATENLKINLNQCHAAFLEANYDEKMLEEGKYPYHLKKRIRGDEGHLSNIQALELFMNHRNPALKLLVLSHLSAQNNSPELVRELFSSHAGGIRIEVASRYQETDVFVINRSE
jgi:phosphoribosyl 1,2-cyclic phosphodiesterase